MAVSPRGDDPPGTSPVTSRPILTPPLRSGVTAGVCGVAAVARLDGSCDLRPHDPWVSVDDAVAKVLSVSSGLCWGYPDFFR